MAYEIKGDALVKRDLTAGRKFSALSGMQANHYIVTGAVDFTTAEPAHVLGEVYRNTTTGTGSTTTGTTFTAEYLYYSDGTDWVEHVPAEGWLLDSASGDSLSRFDGTSWNPVGQSAPYPSWAADTYYAKGDKVNELGFIYQRVSSGTSVSGSFSDEVFYAWNLVEEESDKSRLIDLIMDKHANAENNDGIRYPIADAIYASGGNPWVLEDTDAVVEAGHSMNLPGSVAFESGDTHQFRFRILNAGVANHVIEIRYEDFGNDSAELIEIGTTPAVIAGGTSSGNVSTSATVSTTTVAGYDVVDVDFILSWTGASGATPKITIKPVYNLDGTAVADGAQTGSITIMDIQSGATSDFIFEGEVLATPLDASAGAVAESLPAATGNGAVKFYVVEDKTNTITIAPQAGETLNGVVDLTFYASNYAAGTQFQAVDRAAGVWDLAVVGATSTNEDRSYFMTGVLDDYDPTAGINVLDFTTLVAGGNYPLAEGNDSGWRTSATAFTPPSDGKYRFDLTVDHPGAAIEGANSQVGLGEFKPVVILNGSELALASDGATGAPDTGSGSIVLDLTTSDVITFGFNATTETNEDFFVSVIIEPFGVAEVILAGHVEPTELAKFSVHKTVAQGLTAQTHPASTEVTWDTERYDIGGGFDLANNKFVAPSDGVYHFNASLEFDTPGVQNLYSFISLKVNGSSLLRGGLFDTGDGGADDIPMAAVSGDVQLSAGDEVTIDMSMATGDAITGSADTSYWMGYQLPTSTVVNPDTVPVEDLAYADIQFDVDAGVAYLQAAPGTALTDNISASLTTVSSSNVTVETDGSFTLTQSGRYELFVKHSWNNVDHDGYYGLYKGATLIDEQFINLTGISSPTGFARFEFDGTAGDNLKVYWRCDNVAGDTMDGAGFSRIQIRQLAAKTVTALNPAFTEANDLVNGSVTATVDETFTTGAWVDHTELQLTLPNVGRYRLDANILGRHSSPGSAWYARIVNASDSLIDDSRTGINAGTVNNQYAVTVSGVYTTTSANEVVKVQIWGNAATATIEGNTLPNTGTSKFSYQQLPSTEYVTPGDVPVEDLLSVSFTSATNSSSYVNTDEINLSALSGITFDPESAIDLGQNGVIVPRSGRFQATLVVGGNGTAPNPWIELDGVIVGELDSAVTNSTFTIGCIFDAIAGQKITFHNDSGAYRHSAFTLQQVASKTVTALNPAFTEAEDLTASRFSLSTDSVSSVVCPFDTTDLNEETSRYALQLGGGVLVQPGRYQVTVKPGRQGNLLDWEVWNATAGEQVFKGRLDHSGSIDNTDHASGYVKLTTASEIQLRELDGNTSVVWNGDTDLYGCTIEFIRLPDTQYVTPGDVPVEDLHIVNGGVNSSAVIPPVATSIGAGYQVMDLDDADLVLNDAQGLVNTTTNSIDVTQSGTYRLYFTTSTASTGTKQIAVFVDGIQTALATDATGGTNAEDVSLEKILDLTAGQRVEFGWGASPTLDFYCPSFSVQQLPSKTVINTTDVAVADQASLGYFDVGTMRIAFGTESADAGVKTFPAPFASAPNVIVSEDGSASSDRIIQASSVTTTGFTLTSFNTGTNTASNSGESCSYIAIGLKP